MDQVSAPSYPIILGFTAVNTTSTVQHSDEHKKLLHSKMKRKAALPTPDDALVKKLVPVKKTGARHQRTQNSTVSSDIGSAETKNIIPIILCATTLEKLAEFRYQPSSTSNSWDITQQRQYPTRSSIPSVTNDQESRSVSPHDGDDQCNNDQPANMLQDLFHAQRYSTLHPPESSQPCFSYFFTRQDETKALDRGEFYDQKGLSEPATYSDEKYEQKFDNLIIAKRREEDMPLIGSRIPGLLPLSGEVEHEHDGKTMIADPYDKHLCEEDFLDSDEDEIEEMLRLVDQASIPDRPVHSVPSQSRTPTVPKLQWNAPRKYDSTTKMLSSPLPITPSKPCLPLTPPATASRAIPYETSPQCSSGGIKSPSSSAPHNEPRPFVRPLFPALISSRCIVPSHAPNHALRTCFRIHEALRVATLSTRQHSPALIELYARVISSKRDEEDVGTQYFTFADLFMASKAPKLEGVWTGWKGVEIWEEDAKVFLKPTDSGGRLGRIVGRLERGEKGMWRVVVFNVLEVGWGDIEWVREIVCA